MKLIFGHVPGPLDARRYRKYLEVWNALKQAEPGTWIAVKQADCGGKKLTTKQTVLIISASRQGLRITTRTDGDLVFVRLRGDDPTGKPPIPAPEPAPEPEPVIVTATVTVPDPQPLAPPPVVRVRRPVYGETPIPMQIRLPRSITAFRLELDKALAYLMNDPDPEEWAVVAMDAPEEYFAQLVAEARLTAQHRCPGYTAEVEVEESDLYIRLQPATDY